MVDILQKDLQVISIGIEEFTKSIEAQGISVVHVDWTPPTAGDEEIEVLLESLI